MGRALEPLTMLRAGRYRIQNVPDWGVSKPCREALCPELLTSNGHRICLVRVSGSSTEFSEGRQLFSIAFKQAVVIAEGQLENQKSLFIERGDIEDIS